MRILLIPSMSLFALSGCGDVKASEVTLEAGKAVYAEYCASCHGVSGETASAPSLFDNDWVYGSDLSSIRKNILSGIEDAGMPAFEGGLSSPEIESLLVYVKSGGSEDDPEETIQVTDTNTDDLVPAVDKVDNIENQLVVEDYITGLDEPWGIHFAGDAVLITEKKGRLKIGQKSYELASGWIVSEVAGIPEVNNQRQGGLLDVATDPDFDGNGWVYLTYSHALNGTSGPSMTKLVRGKIYNNQWIDEETLFEAKPEDYLDTGFHYGSRITFDDQGHLFFSIGDRGPKEKAQDRNLPNGKIHRIYRDGSIPSSNPFPDAKYPSIYSYGNRNPQGLVWHAGSGVLWETEHGPRGGDELNVIRSGNNYGWPKISYGINYNGTVLTEHQALPGMAQPASQWTPSIAVCGLDVYTGDLFPEWKGRLLAGSLAFQSLRLIDVAGDRYKGELEILKDKGRIRDVTTGPDGAIYVALPKKIVRLSPK